MNFKNRIIKKLNYRIIIIKKNENELYYKLMKKLEGIRLITKN